MHLNLGILLFQKPKTSSKMKLLEEEKKYHVKDFQEILDVIFFSFFLPTFHFSVFFLNF